MRNKVSYRLLLLVGVLSVSLFSLNTFVMLPAAVVVSDHPQQLLQSAFATFPGENGLIAFSAQPDPQTVLGIYVMRSDGTGQIRINAEDGYGVLSSGPAWSPDGSKIAFSHYDATSVSNIHVMNYDGSNQIALTNYPIDSYIFNGKISWSPDGSKMAFTSIREDGQSDIYIMNAADGSEVQRLTTNTREDQYPDWSPDGSKIVFESNRDGNFELYVINADGSNETRLTRTSNEHEQLASWSPDGSKIAFQSGNNPDIYVMNADGTGRVQLTNNVGEQPVWSPEGDKIAFTTGYQEIYVMDAANGSNQVPLTGEQLLNENGPDWGTQTVLPSYEQDTTPPVITVPEDITEQATTANGGTVVTYNVTAEDNVDGTATLEEDNTLTQDEVGGDITISCDPPSGSEFPIGDTEVQCIATDEAGNEGTASFTVTVNPPPPVPDPLTAEIRSNATEGVEPATFEFEAIVTGGTEPYTYNWDFGDGSSQISNEQTVVHTYDEAGVYTVILTVTDAGEEEQQQQEATDTLEITVNERPPPPPPPPPPTTPREAIERLIIHIENLEDVPENAKTRLTSVLERALAVLSDDNTRNDASACNMVGGAFINQVNANERRDTLAEDQSAELRTQADNIRDMLGC